MILNVKGLQKSFDDKDVLKGIDLELYRGQIVALIGSSGSGKSTLLRCVNLLEEISDGQIFLNDEDISDPQINQDEIRRQVGLVFQAYNLFAHLSIEENITLALRHVKGLSTADAKTKALALLDRIGLAEKADEYPDKLSGGQQQRTAIMRAVALEPTLLLLDEVTSALDPELVGEVLELIRDLKAGGTSILMATHELTFARDVADWVVFLDGGVIIEEGPAKEFFSNPQNPRTIEFLQRLRRRAGDA
ncbi:MAG: amino acid ABC transporter ATP-binding protein [Micrococcales bacterium]|nr:amino acid ABC transporter ATP-binding protein [Actinomycetota bacterium]NCA07748.1 amino acid ABC transporter ATP-binding protein [Micrococcales bacterium]